MADVVLFLDFFKLDIGIQKSLPIIARSIRVFRIVKYVKASKQIKVLIETIFALLPGLFRISLLMFLIILIYSILGMSLFYRTKLKYPLNE